MKKLLSLIILTIFFSFKSQCQEKINYANLLEKCFTQNEIKLLNNGCEIFENEILKIYTNENIGISYKEFLEDIQTMQIPLEVFENKKTTEYMNNLKKSELFNKIWEIYKREINTEIVVISNDDNESKPEEEYFQIKRDGKYLNCLIENYENQNLKELLKAIKEVPDINPAILAIALTNEFKEEEFNSNIMRLIIAIDFYYELKLNLMK
ncbi:hypothetical protein AXE80_07205 [Wenyingzhuangia fucanilytica]|uniref:Uncharacterized protein n=1 Tax=Wenyingzhuangia fucanilytica TaxID=1790137 RepID=A0A1B1Y5Q9_9FLAO|nr:hypothetical protein [Wenyingzhuangia fucanilytica]ANW96077.1 hypothetical protein AXE80_07205 [Wenyingzhuangia fucanilytica]